MCGAGRLRFKASLARSEQWPARRRRLERHRAPRRPNDAYSPLEASGASISAPGGPRLGLVSGIVTKRAARLRVYLRTGHPLELVPVDARDPFPVNFYAGLYQQPEHNEPPYSWQVVRLVAHDKAGRRGAQYQHGHT